MNGYIISLILDKNPKDYQMTRKLLEIERKRQLTSDAEELFKQLRELGFELQSNLHEIDTYYSRSDVDFMQTVECLRIRQRDGFAEVTYKPATTAATHTENDVIIKPETNLPIQPEDAATAKQLLTNLGMVRLSRSTNTGDHSSPLIFRRQQWL